MQNNPPGIRRESLLFSTPRIASHQNLAGGGWDFLRFHLKVFIPPPTKVPPIGVADKNLRKASRGKEIKVGVFLSSGLRPCCKVEVRMVRKERKGVERASEGNVLSTDSP
uniref:Uncharacterized protein n=1 Tax=Micrurus surinamensis TaxID=129470 RepID=A0A2D4PL32_MICSU